MIVTEVKTLMIKRAPPFFFIFLFFVFLMRDDTFTWTSKKEPIVTLLTCEEVIYFYSFLFLRHYAFVMHFSSIICWMSLIYHKKKTMMIYVDNKLVITLSKNPVFQDWTKHFNKRYHCIWEYIMKKEVQLKFVNSSLIALLIILLSFSSLKILKGKKCYLKLQKFKEAC